MREYTNSEKCLIFLDNFLGLEYKHKIQIVDMIDGDLSLEEFVKKACKYILQFVGEKEYSTIKASANKEYMQFLLDNLGKRAIKVTTLLSKDYPKCLRQINCPPIVIYYKGNLSLASDENFAIVGSRKSLPLSIDLTKQYSKALIDAGFTLVTGCAEAVDSTVIISALNNGGKIISVVAGGFDNIYPKTNLNLIEKVAVHDNGLVISEHPPQIKPLPFHFPIRNRIIAGLAKGVLIVSGGLKSGTLYTAEYAEEFSRDVFAIPYSVGVMSGAGCNELIKKGALLTDTPQDILNFYNKTKKNNKIELSESEKQIVSVLKDGQLHIEKICNLLNKQVFEITPLLSILEIKGLIVKSGNVYGLTRNDLEG